MWISLEITTNSSQKSELICLSIQQEEAEVTLGADLKKKKEKKNAYLKWYLMEPLQS